MQGEGGNRRRRRADGSIPGTLETESIAAWQSCSVLIFSSCLSSSFPLFLSSPAMVMILWLLRRQLSLHTAHKIKPS